MMAYSSSSLYDHWNYPQQGYTDRDSTGRPLPGGRYWKLIDIRHNNSSQYRIEIYECQRSGERYQVAIPDPHMQMYYASQTPMGSPNTIERVEPKKVIQNDKHSKNIAKLILHRQIKLRYK